MIALPLALRTISPAVNAVPQDLHDASASLGANPLRTWIQIDAPLLRPALTKAAGLCAAVSLGEFGATSFLSRSNSTTIPIAIGQLLSHPGSVMTQAAFALATLTVVAVSALI
jgi:thiamine transport system permease protein